MKCIKQFRYYGYLNGKDKDNYPDTSIWSGKQFYENLCVGNIFRGYGSISQLGIQGRPGTKFYLNGSQYPIIIGETGIYEIDLEGHGRIYSIRFDEATLKIFDEPTVTDRLLIDIIYEGSGVSS